jgi:hypothetical protein
MAGDIVGNRFHLVSGDAASGGAPGTHIDTDVHEVPELDAVGRRVLRSACALGMMMGIARATHPTNDGSIDHRKAARDSHRYRCA